MAASDYSIHVFDLDQQRLVGRLTGHFSGAVSLRFSPTDANVLASASWDRTARLWDLSSGKQIQQFDHAGWLSSVDFSPDARRIVTASADGSIKLWMPETGRQVISIRTGVPHPRHV